MSFMQQVIGFWFLLIAVIVVVFLVHSIMQLLASEWETSVLSMYVRIGSVFVATWAIAFLLAKVFYGS